MFQHPASSELSLSFPTPAPGSLLRRGLQMWPSPRAVGGRTAVAEELPRCPTNEDIKSPIKRLELPPGDLSRAFSSLEWGWPV